MRRFVQVTLALFAVFSVVFALMRTEDARASVGYSSPYTYEQTFGTALRMLRVDYNLDIKEKDADLGYVLFDYRSPESGDRISRGSMELVRGKDGVQVRVQLPEMPSYHERMLVDALAKKLENEHGMPMQKKKPKKDESKDKPKDGEAEGDAETDGSQK